MSARAAMLAGRRIALVAKSARLRGALGAEARALALRFGLADRVLRIARSGLARALLAGGAALLLFGRPRRLFRNAARLLLLWPLLKRFWPDLAALWRAAERA